MILTTYLMLLTNPSLKLKPSQSLKTLLTMISMPYSMLLTKQNQKMKLSLKMVLLMSLSQKNSN